MSRYLVTFTPTEESGDFAPTEATIEADTARQTTLIRRPQGTPHGALRRVWRVLPNGARLEILWNDPETRELDMMDDESLMTELGYNA